MKTKKTKLTKAQWQSVVDAMDSAYWSSEAMMVTDLMRGFKTVSKKYGLGEWWDGQVFGEASRLARLGRHQVNDVNVESLNAALERDRS